MQATENIVFHFVFKNLNIRPNSYIIDKVNDNFEQFFFSTITLFVIFHGHYEYLDVMNVKFGLFICYI